MRRRRHEEAAGTAADAAFAAAPGTALAGVLITAGLLLFVVPGVVLIIRYSALWPVIVLEQRGGWAAFRRSHDLARGRGRKLVAVVGLASVIAMALSLGGQLAFEQIVHDTRTAWLVATVLLSLLSPVLTALAVLAYYDAKMEAEGYDLEVAASALPETPGGQPTAT